MSDDLKLWLSLGGLLTEWEPAESIESNALWIREKVGNRCGRMSIDIHYGTKEELKQRVQELLENFDERFDQFAEVVRERRKGLRSGASN